MGGYEEIVLMQCMSYGDSTRRIKGITEAFDKTTKLSFRGVNSPSSIRFGGMRDRDVSENIKTSCDHPISFILGQPGLSNIASNVQFKIALTED